MERQIKNLYETTELTLQKIADSCNLSYDQVWRFIRDNYSVEKRKERKRVSYKKSKIGNKNPMKGKTKEQHHNYKDVVEDGKGYLLVLKPSWYSGREGSKYIFQHHEIICSSLGITEIPNGFVVHHIDENKKNNSIHNLVLLTNEAHLKLHHS